MKFLHRGSLATLFAFALLLAPLGYAQTSTPKTEKKSAASPDADTQKKNIQEYISLLRSNVRQEKAEIMGSIMALSAADAAKFWPIYSAYDADLTKLND